MRVLPFIFAVFPVALWAEDIPLTSRVTDVTLYPQGATIHRQVPFTTPQGQHDLILIDLPAQTDLESVRVSVTGATMGGVTVRRDFVPPRSDESSAAFMAAEEFVERLERALRVENARIARVRLAQDAAEAQVAFLAQLGTGESAAQMDVSALRDLTQMIGEQTLAARQAAHDAALQAEEAERGLKDALEALEKARQARDALIQDTDDRALLAVSITADAPGDGQLDISYQSYDAGWSPVNDVHLDRAAATLTLTRGAMVQQFTGESWENVALTLSTVRPSGQPGPTDIRPWLRRIEDPVQIVRKEAVGAAYDQGLMSSAPMPAPMMEDARVIMADASFDGLSVTYRYPDTVSVATGADALRIALGDLQTTATLEARAVPLYDETAYLVASFTNDMGEMILPGRSSLYLDGTLIGQMQTGLMAAGDEAELPFGPIEGLRLTRVVLQREEGGSGLISKVNDLSETVRIEAKNLTDVSWALRVLDRVPYSEQEDLTIEWSANPRPAETDVDDQRGVLAWSLDLAPGATQVITVDQALRWPEGKVLR
ncbi:mucoidy inhibitor MuiA family protein [Rhodobacteraceae bacterium KMM 6894]|nr:mucoidy inhibitor MuiA family protein [Rhodobacteraceae bacterium KMM 6894]